ncbi:hypothetical protein [Nonomuraea basaltis]|uniref:hypothetical protein n=1 Tax=Nonomuraea basaltis TaxID=2495887 RepID=UPI00110C4B16|nr:hypothetical protein [Nonomuraea basaltis]TMR93115.1 hypothetical protein EJK15_41110 [Nonomuraea basaltis]
MLNDQVTFRRVTAGVLLIVAPLLQAIAVFVDPGTWGDDREAVSFGANPALAQAQSALYHWSWILMPIAALGLVHLTRRRATRLGHVAGGMTVIGYISLSGLLLSDPVEWWLGQHYSPEQAQKILDEMLNLPGVIFAFQMPWMFFGFIGLPVLTVAVWRAGFVGWWVPLVVAVGYLGSFAVSYGPATALFWTVPVVALGWTGLKILKMGDEAWAAYYPAARDREPASA